VRRLPSQTRARQLSRTAHDLLDLSDDVDPERDHIRGPDDAAVTLVEYGDFDCEYCGQAEGPINDVLASFSDEVRYVWRHLPLNDVHPDAQMAAEFSEAAAAQGALLGDARPAARAQRRTAARRPRALRPAARPGRRPDGARAASSRVCRPRERGRRQRGRERRLGHAELLHQRAPALRRVRPRRPDEAVRSARNRATVAAQPGGA